MVRAVVASALLFAASADTVQKAYVIGSIHSNYCPSGSQEVVDEGECRDAAASVGGKYKSAGNWSNYPGGCYGNPLDSKVWMNNNPGDKNSVYAKVCRKDGEGDISIRITSDGLERIAVLHVPKGATGKIPLVVDNHAWGSMPFEEALLSGFSGLADKEGFAVVYPRGHDLGQPLDAFHLPIPGGFGYSFNAGACCPHSSINKRQDVQFIRDLIAHVADLVPKSTSGAMEIDQTRVYAAGMSNGGFFTNRLACEARDLFAAVAPVSGVLINGSSPTWGGDPFYCPPHDPPLPVLHFHGTLDAAVPWEGNPILGFPSIAKYTATRLRLNGIPDDDEGTVSYKHRDVTCTSHGPEAANVTVCKVSGGGHSWPGSKYLCRGAVPPFQCSMAIDATAQMWEFFKRYSLKPSTVEV